jgi:hypothetical protein
VTDAGSEVMLSRTNDAVTPVWKFHPVIRMLVVRPTQTAAGKE